MRPGLTPPTGSWLGHIVVGIGDMDDNVRFYRDALGMKISDYVQVERSPGVVTNFTFLHCNSRHHSIAFGKPGTPPGRFNHVMFQLQELDDVGATYDLCEREGIQGLSRLGRHPNDQMVSFYIPTPSGWGVEWGWGARTVDDATWQIQTYTRMSNWGHQRPGRAQPAREPAVAGD
jgi:2,3-dihydroxybiphenyl 1,2-dioxygenase